MSEERGSKDYEVYVDYPNPDDGPIVARVLDTLFNCIYAVGSRVVRIDTEGPDVEDDAQG
jgi:hypothetical protein